VTNALDDAALAKAPLDSHVTLAADQAPLSPASRWSNRKRIAGLCWATVIAISYATWLPLAFANMVIVGWLTAVAFSMPVDVKGVTTGLRDWLLLLIFLQLYVRSRSIADTLGMPIQEQVMIDIDRVFGFGETWIHRTQRWIDWEADPSLWELGFPIIYLSHFIVPLSLLTYLYVRNRDRWRSYMHRWTLLSFLGLVGYVLLPTVPPWMSSDRGTVDFVHKGLERDWSVFNLGVLGDLFRFGTDATNTVAAMPSLHCAYPALIVLFFAPGRGHIGRALLVLYALFMGFTVVITGQHWVIDVVAGWAVAVVAHVAVGWFESRRVRVPAETTVVNS